MAAGPHGGRALPAVPTVSVLVATRRPRLLARAIASVAKQDYPALELVLALHGEGFDRARVASCLGRCPHPATVLAVERERVLGEVLNAATAAAGGALIAKMDDDDAYAPDVVSGLVAAWQASDAELVGKGNEVVYLKARDRTLVLERPAVGPVLHVTGAALLLHRDDLHAAGGWRRWRSMVDVALGLDVIRAGGVVYQTGGAGYVYVRHGDAPASPLPDRVFEDRAQSVHAGWRPDLAGILDEPAP